MRTKAIIKRGKVYSIHFSGLMSMYFHENTPVFNFLREELRLFWRYARKEEKDLSVLREELVKDYFKKAFVSKRGGGKIRRIIVENTIRRYCNWLPEVCKTTCRIHAPLGENVRKERFAAETIKGAGRLKYDAVNEIIAYYGRIAPRMPTAKDFSGLRKTILKLKGIRYARIWFDLAAIAEIAGLQKEFKEYKANYWYERKDWRYKDDALLVKEEESVVKRKVALPYTKKERVTVTREIDEQCRLVREMMRKYNY